MRTWILLGTCLALGCASSSSAPTLSRSGERRVDIQDRSGTLVSTRLRADNNARQRRLTVGIDQAWTRLPELLAEVGLSIGTLDDANRHIAHNGARVSRIDGKRMATYLNCGLGTTAEPNANAYQVTLGYEVILMADDSATTLAEMRVDAAARPRDLSGNPVRCTSKGTLERLVFDSLEVADRE